MATVHSLSGPPPAGGSSPRGPTYHVATRELSADFITVGPDQEPRDLGLIDVDQFRKLLDQLAALESIKLVDADPQLIVSVKSGRFLIQPQSGKLLIRPMNALDQIFFKLSPAEIPPFLDGAPPPPPKAFTTLIGSATARAESRPPMPVPANPKPPAKKSRRPLLLVALIAGGLVAAGAAWIFMPRTSAAAPPPPAIVQNSPPAFDPITTPAVLASLHKRFVGTYVTSGEAGERMLELRDDGTFHYQEFGAGLTVTRHENGPYQFWLRHGTQTSVLRATGLDPIELRDENSLALGPVVFTRLPAPAK